VSVKTSNLASPVRKLQNALDLAFPLAIVKEKVAREWVPEDLGGAFIATDINDIVSVAGDAGDLDRKSALLRSALIRMEGSEGPEEPR
jgi:hypothetical protein